LEVGDVLAWLKKRLGRIRLIDPVLGDLLYMGGYWEGAGTFAGTGDHVEWFVDAPQEGPGESQRQLFRAIAERYATLLPAVHEVLAKQVAEWDPTVVATPVSQLVKLVGIDLRESESPTMEWELSCDSTLKGTPQFGVAMRGWVPTGHVDVST
jgi:hypothetical protein